MAVRVAVCVATDTTTMARTLHQSKLAKASKASSEEVQGNNNIIDDCSIGTVQVSNVRRATLSPTNSGENRRSSNEDQEQNIALRVVINDRLNGIIGGLTDAEKKLLLRSLKQALDESEPNADDRVPLTRFREIFQRYGNTNAIDRFHGQYTDNPELVTSVVSIALTFEKERARQRQRERTRRLQQAQQERAQRMAEISDRLGQILNETTRKAAEVAYIVEALALEVVEDKALSLEHFTDFVRNATGRGVTALQPQLANQFVDLFNRDLPGSAEKLTILHAEVERRLEGGPIAIGPDAASLSSLSDDLGLYLSGGDSSSRSRSQDTPWLGRYFDHGS